VAPGRRIARSSGLRHGVARRAEAPRSNLGHVNAGAPACAGAEVIDSDLAALDRPSQSLGADAQPLSCLRDRGELRPRCVLRIQAFNERAQPVHDLVDAERLAVPRLAPLTGASSSAAGSGSDSTPARSRVGGDVQLSLHARLCATHEGPFGWGKSRFALVFPCDPCLREKSTLPPTRPAASHARDGLPSRSRTR